MRKLLLCFAVLSTAFLANAQTDTLIYRKIGEEIKRKFAADKRDVYFNLSIKADSARLETSSAVVIKEFEKLLPKNSSTGFSSSLLPSKSLNGKIYGLANISVANNRTNPQHGAELSTQMLLGTPVQILKKQGGFYLVKTPDQYLAWTDAGAIVSVDEQGFKNWQNSEKIVFTADFGFAYSKPNAESPRVSDLVHGNVLQVLKKDGVFIQVSFPDGREGYVLKSSTLPFQSWVGRPNPDGKLILEQAFKLVGVPYLWGGTSIKGVDCSGFTKTAFFLNGIIIPRDASQQALVGDPIDVMENDSVSVDKCLKNLKAGDLMFFSASKRRGVNGGKITHTAIYIGNGEFVQSAGMVKVSSLIVGAANYDGGQTPTLVGARRYLNVIGSAQISRVDAHEWYVKENKHVTNLP